MSGLMFPKTSKGDRLRKARADHGKASRSLSALYSRVYKRDGYRCVVCKSRVAVGGDTFTKAHPHHIIFRSQASKADKHTEANVCTLCPFCHADVHDRKLWVTGRAPSRLKVRRTP